VLIPCLCIRASVPRVQPLAVPGPARDSELLVVPVAAGGSPAAPAAARAATGTAMVDWQSESRATAVTLPVAGLAVTGLTAGY